MKLTTLAAAALLLFAATPSAAQVPVAAGTRIRISTPVFHNNMEVVGSAAWKTGVVKSMNATTLVLQTSDTDEIDIPVSVIRRMEVHEGAMSGSEGWRQGARRGAAAGGGLMLVLAGIQHLFLGSDLGEEGEEDGVREPRNNEDFVLLPSSAGGVARNVGIGAAVGAGVGVLFGSRSHERWTAVDLGRTSLHLSPAVGAAGTGVSLSLRF